MYCRKFHVYFCHGSSHRSKYFSMEAKGFKRFSVSVGALHVMPQGKAPPFTVQTAVPDGTVSKTAQLKLIQYSTT